MESLSIAAYHRRSESVSGADRAPSQSLVFPKHYVAGCSAAMGEVYRQMEVFSATDLPVLVVGETGVGKEPLVRTLHASSRRPGPFVALNCAAVPGDLLESELFGIERGVATGVEARRGKFREAHRGTLFLDEIGEIPPGLQAKLLRALQEPEILPVGGDSVSVDVRILAATNADLQREIDQGEFRADLYYRLAGATLEVPPLRRRPEEIPTLVEHFLERFAAKAGKRVPHLSAGALEALLGYSWPGNVRELEHEIHRLVLLSPDLRPIGVELLSERIRGRRHGRPAAGGGLPGGTLHLATLERCAVAAALERSGGNQSRAAELLGISRYSLRRRIERFRLDDGAS